MSRNERVLGYVGAALLCALISGCSQVDEPQVETETHFLVACEASCDDGLSCICGVCTVACSGDDTCSALASSARCASAPAGCGAAVESTCDVECSSEAGCQALGSGYACVDGRCRAPSDAGSAGAGGASGGSGGSSGAAGSAGGGTGGAGAGGDAGGGQSGAGAGGAGGDAGGDGGVVTTDCNEIGEACCDPFPADGPNYCDSVLLLCGANNTCEVNCDCPLGAYVPVCGVDGESYDSTCGLACVPVEVACRGECPCEGSCTVPCTGAAPEQEVIDACQAITEMSACESYQTGGFPSTCRWVTPTTEPCPALP